MKNTTPTKEELSTIFTKIIFMAFGELVFWFLHYFKDLTTISTIRYIILSGIIFWGIYIYYISQNKNIIPKNIYNFRSLLMIYIYFSIISMVGTFIDSTYIPMKQYLFGGIALPHLFIPSKIMSIISFGIICHFYYSDYYKTTLKLQKTKNN